MWELAIVICHRYFLNRKLLLLFMVRGMMMEVWSSAFVKIVFSAFFVHKLSAVVFENTLVSILENTCESQHS